MSFFGKKWINVIFCYFWKNKKFRIFGIWRRINSNNHEWQNIYLTFIFKMLYHLDYLEIGFFPELFSLVGSSRILSDLVGLWTWLSSQIGFVIWSWIVIWHHFRFLSFEDVRTLSMKRLYFNFLSYDSSRDFFLKFCHMTSV